MKHAKPRPRWAKPIEWTTRAAVAVAGCLGGGLAGVGIGLGLVDMTLFGAAVVAAASAVQLIWRQR